MILSCSESLPDASLMVSNPQPPFMQRESQEYTSIEVRLCLGVLMR